VPARAWQGLLLTLVLVLLLHLLFLRSVSRLLPDMPDGMAGEDAGRVFSTRSIRIDNREAAATAQATQDISKAPKPVAPTAPPAANTGLPPDAPQGNTLSFSAEAAPVVPPNTDEAAAQPATVASGTVTAASATTAPSAAVPEAASSVTATAPATAATVASAPLAATPANTTAPPVSDASLSPAPASTVQGTPPPAYNYVFPPSVRLKYDVAGIVKGFK
jgi:hypothetical protein